MTMPRPVYILCSESGSEDRNTGLSSFFNIVEILKAVLVDPANAGVRQAISITIRTTAVWMRSEGEPPDAAYEFEFALILPNHTNSVVLHRGHFQFTTPFHRMVMVGQFPGFPSLGLFEIECRARVTGAQEWARQSFPFIVEEGQLPARQVTEIHIPPQQTDQA
jgi:hypothetical protein